MPRFAANLTMIYREHDFLDRFAAAAADGFRGVEYLFPYAFKKERLAEALRRHDLVQVLHNLPAGDWDKGEHGIASIPGFYVNRVGQAAALIEEAGSANLFIQYDFYHQQRTEGEFAANFSRFKGKIAHVQLADDPGRNEPGIGEINCSFLFDFLDRGGYAGWLSCEYKPKGRTSEGLG